MSQSTATVQPSASRRAVSRIFGRYIVNNRFQFKFSLIIFGFLCFATLSIWLLGRFVIEQIVASGQISSEGAILQLRVLNGLVFKTGVLSISIVFAMSLFFSHFIAGPIYRFERTLEEIRDGNLGIQVRLRKHDEFKETADLFNQALAGLRNKLKKERDVVQLMSGKVRDVAAKLRQAGREAEASELEHTITDLQNTPPQIKF